MKKILVLGAGRSSASLIRYLGVNAPAYGWEVTVGDSLLAFAEEKTSGYQALTPIAFDIFSDSAAATIAAHDIVVSLLPPHLHIQAARHCLEFNKHLITASYVSEEMSGLNEQARAKGLLFLNEMGLDPGIDHLSAQEMIDKIHSEGGKINGFKSFTGGLIAPESDNNPWHYKFTWNPRNVVLAGQGTARYLENHEYKYLPYHQLFKRIELIEVEGYGVFEGYANRDSLGYQSVYGLNDTATILRGTLRKEGYCAAWNVLLQLGMTDDTYQISTKGLTKRSFLNAFLPFDATKTVEEKLQDFAGISVQNGIYKKIEWLGFFEASSLAYPAEKASPAQILQYILEDKWKLQDGDKDMIVMQHIFDYEINGVAKRTLSELVVIGEDTTHTAMAKTVGLPLAIATRLLFTNAISLRGVLIPVDKQIYEPSLKELADLGIVFKERDVQIS